MFSQEEETKQSITAMILNPQETMLITGNNNSFTVYAVRRQDSFQLTEQYKSAHLFGFRRILIDSLTWNRFGQRARVNFSEQFSSSWTHFEQNTYLWYKKIWALTILGWILVERYRNLLLNIPNPLNSAYYLQPIERIYQ